jgi:hypothetical protein
MSGLPVIKMSSSLLPTGFSHRDLELLDHFVRIAYPPLPLSSNEAWTRHIPQMALHHTHLKYALLALAMSHLDGLSIISTRSCDALALRGRAIQSLREALEKPDLSVDEYDAILASCYSLAFQSALLYDARLDFVTFVRGCSMITAKIQRSNFNTVFHLSHESMQPPRLQRTSSRLLLTKFPACSTGDQLATLLRDGIVALGNLKISFSDGDLMGANFFPYLESIFAGFQVSLSDGYDYFLSYCKYHPQS